MSLTITLSPDAEAALTERAREQGRTVDECASDIVSQTLLPSSLISAAEKLPPKQGTPEWIKEFRAWAAGHEPVNHFVDDSRETIYGGPEGRGE